MRDGSDAVSDWPLLNALLNTAGGATWVSLHHGGGVGMGYSQHAGVVIVCDGTDAAAKRIERVLWNDPATGVMRHADAGYDDAVACAQGAGPEPADGERADGCCRPGALTLDDLQAIHAGGGRAGDSTPRRAPAIRASAAVVQRAARGDAAGLRRQHRLRQAGLHAHQREPTSTTLQLNLIRSHSVGVGAPLQPPVVRLMLALKAAQPGARRLGRAGGRGRHAARGAQRRPGAVRAEPGLGRRVGRPGAAGAHDAGADGRGRVPGRRRAPAGRRVPARSRHRAADAARQGRAWR